MRWCRAVTVAVAAGQNRNYGTLEAAIDGLEVNIPGDPAPRTYGPPPDADVAPTSYLFTWDEDQQTYVLVDGPDRGDDSTTTTAG